MGTGPFCVGPQGLAEALGAADIVDWIGLDVPDVGFDRLCALWTISPTRGPELGHEKVERSALVSVTARGTGACGASMSDRARCQRWPGGG